MVEEARFGDAEGVGWNGFAWLVASLVDNILGHVVSFAKESERKRKGKERKEKKCSGLRLFTLACQFYSARDDSPAQLNERNSSSSSKGRLGRAGRKNASVVWTPCSLIQR